MWISVLNANYNNVFINLNPLQWMFTTILLINVRVSIAASLQVQRRIPRKSTNGLDRVTWNAITIHIRSKRYHKLNPKCPAQSVIGLCVLHCCVGASRASLPVDAQQWTLSLNAGFNYSRADEPCDCAVTACGAMLTNYLFLNNVGTL